MISSRALAMSCSKRLSLMASRRWMMANALLRGPLGAALGLIGDERALVWIILIDAHRSGKRAAYEGNVLGTTLAEILGQLGGSLGGEFHLIGKSPRRWHDGARGGDPRGPGAPGHVTDNAGHRKQDCLPLVGCFIGSLQYVGPSATLETATAVFHTAEHEGDVCS